MKSWIVGLLAPVIFLSVTAMAQRSGRGEGGGRGPHDGGGGDTNADAFVLYAKQLSKWFNSHSQVVQPQDAAKIAGIVNQIAKDMDGQVKGPIEFTPDEVKDQFGISKMAVFRVNPMSVRVQQRRWELLTVVHRYKLVALELFGLAGVQSRYGSTGFVEENFSDIAGSHTYSQQELTLASAPILREIFNQDRYIYSYANLISRSFPEEGFSTSIAHSGLQSHAMRLAKEFTRQAGALRMMPLQLQFDILVSGTATFPALPEKNVLFNVTTMRNVQPTTEMLGSVAAKYVTQVQYVLDLYLNDKGNGEISPALRADLQALKNKVDAVAKIVDASRTAFTDFLQASIDTLRARAFKDRCHVPSTFDTDFKWILKNVDTQLAAAKDRSAELAALNSTAQAQSKWIISTLSQVSSDMYKMLHTYPEFDKIVFPGRGRVDSENVATGVYYLINTAHGLEEMVERNFMEEAQILESMSKKLETGDLCVAL